MSAGSLRSVSKSIEALLSPKEKGQTYNDGGDLYSLDPDTAENILLYIEKHYPIDPAESTRLHDELVRLHKAYILTDINPNAELLFVKCLIDFVPCLINTEIIEEWFGRYSEPAIDSAGHRNALVKVSREFLLALLLSGTNINVGSASDGDDESKRKLEEIYLSNSREIARKILALYLKGDDGDYSFTSNVDNMLKGEESMKSEERRRFSKSNAENILIQFGMKSPKEFLTVISEKFVESKARIQLLALLSAYVSQQPPYLFQIRSTPLLDNLYQCLIHDKSSFGLSICATVLAMTLPHICDTLVDQLPQLFSIYGRLCSWQLELGDDDEDATSDYGDVNDESKKKKVNSTSDGWQVLNNLMDIQDPRGPIITPLFTFLYGLFPANLISFLRQPNEYLENAGYKRPFDDFWDKHSIQQLSKPCLELHTLNPNLLSMSKEQELSDTNRWQFMGSAFDIASQCLSLYNPRQDFPKRSSQQVASITSSVSKPQFRVPFEEINNLFEPEIEQPNQDGDEAQTPLSESQEPNKRTSYFNAHPTLSSRHSSNLDPVSRDDSITSPTNTTSHFRASFLSPGLSSVEALLSDHERLYSKRELVLPILEKRDSIVAIPEELNLDDVNSPTNPISNNSNLNTLRRGRSGTLSSPAFQPLNNNVPPAIHSPLLLSQPNQVAAAAASAIAAVSATGSAAGTGTTSSPNISTTVTASPTTAPVSGDQKQLEKQFNLTIAFYQRELLLIRNELEFVSFVEHQTQHRFSKLREKLKESTLANAQIDKLVVQNKSLKAALEKPELEAAKYQKSLRTYKSERQAYEASLVQRNKDFRVQVNTLKQELEETKIELEKLQREKASILDSITSQEAAMSKMELRLADAEERTVLFETQQKTLEAMKQKLDALENKNEQNEDVSEPHTKQIEALQANCEELQIAYRGVEAEKERLISDYNKRITDLQTLVTEYEDRMNQNGPSHSSNIDISEYIKSFKESSETRYNQLYTAYNELSDRFDDLSVRFREVLLSDEEHKSNIDQPVLPKRSLLGYEMVVPEEEIGGSSNSNPATVPTASPKVTRTTTETRIRGRGGVQNTTTTSSNSASKSPTMVQSQRRPFRGYG